MAPFRIKHESLTMQKQAMLHTSDFPGPQALIGTAARAARMLSGVSAILPLAAPFPFEVRPQCP